MTKTVRAAATCPAFAADGAGRLTSVAGATRGANAAAAFRAAAGRACGRAAVAADTAGPDRAIAWQLGLVRGGAAAARGKLLEFGHVHSPCAKKVVGANSME